jgi:hypothetical protein
MASLLKAAFRTALATDHPGRNELEAAPHVVARVAINRDCRFHADLKVLTGPCRRPSGSELRSRPRRDTVRGRADIGEHKAYFRGVVPP